MRVLSLLASVLQALRPRINFFPAGATAGNDFADSLSLLCAAIDRQGLRSECCRFVSPQTLIGQTEHLWLAANSESRAFIRKDEQRLPVVAVRVAVADTDPSPCYSTASKAGAWPWTAY